MERIRKAMVAATLSALSFGAVTLPAHAAAPAPTTPKPSSQTYVVAAGDYFTSIARKLGVSVNDLIAVNKLAVTSVIVPGQKLIVPEGGTLPAPAAPAPAATPAATPAPAASAPAPYVVAGGDSLARVAGRLGVSMTSLLRANKLTITSVIHPGTQLTVPAGGTLPAATPTAPAMQTNNAAPAAPAATPAAAPAAPMATYTVVAGDYLVGIAAKNRVTLKALLAANNLITTSAIFPGRQLSLPPATLPIPAAAAPATSPATSPASPADPAATTPAIPGPINTVLTFLQAQVGKPYVFNTAGPDTYDCSGLVMAAYQTISISLPHQSMLQSTKGTAVDWYHEPLLPGDLIFQYSSANPTVISHVGIVIDATHWIQAASSSAPIRIGLIPSNDKIKAVRRIVTG